MSSFSKNFISPILRLTRVERLSIVTNTILRSFTSLLLVVLISAAVGFTGILADERPSGSVPYVGTIYTNDSTLGAWTNIVSQNSGQAFGVIAQTASIDGLDADINSASSTLPDQSEVGQYLLIGTTSNNIAKGVNVQNGDLGANHIMLSDEINDNVDFDNRDVFEGGPTFGAPKNWTDADDTPSYGVFPGGAADYLQATSQALPGFPSGKLVTAANVFEGTDWTGNVALTSPNAKFDMSNVEIYADLGVVAASSSPVSSVSNSKYFADGVAPFPGNAPTNGQPLPPNGLTSGATTQMAALRIQLDQWEAFIRDLAPEVTLTGSDLPLNNQKLWVINIDQYDTNNDGIAVIDLNFGGSDFSITNSNVVIESAKNTFAIFRIRGGSNLVLNQSTIVLGAGYTGGVRDVPVDFLGAVFVKMTGYSNGQGGWNAGEPGNSGDTVFSFNDTVLNGVAFWDLIVFGRTENNAPSGSPSGNANFDNGTTELKINNGQGCSQFISPKINFNNVRWNRCSEAAGTIQRIGDRVWEDSNGNGIQDTGESGLPNVTVELYQGNTLVTSTSTDASGIYTFTVAPGDYSVKFIAPMGYVFTQPNQGGDDTADSDADPVTGETATFTITSGQVDTSWDAGLLFIADYTITKTLNTPEPVRTGELISFTIRITNTGLMTITMLPLIDTYDANYLSYVGAVPESNDNIDDGAINWSDLLTTPPNGTGQMQLLPGAAVTVVTGFSAVRDTSLLPNESTVNTATVTGAQADPDGPGGVPAQTLPSKSATDDVRIFAPTAVTLVDYGVSSDQAVVRVHWETTTESNIAYFELYRVDGELRLLLETRAAVNSGQPTGAAYVYEDTDVVLNAWYEYELRVIGLDSSTVSVGIGRVYTGGVRLFLPSVTS